MSGGEEGNGGRRRKDGVKGVLRGDAEGVR